MTPEIERLIHDVLHGEAGLEDRRRLSAWISSDPANARAYFRVALDERAIRSSLERDAARSLEELAESPDDSGAGMVLAELAKAEAKAKPTLVELIDLRTKWWQRHAKPLISAAGVAVAAVIVLAVTLVMQDPGPTQGTLSFDTPGEQTEPGSSVVQGSAVLTAQYDAVWQGMAGETLPEVGDALAAGRKLILAEGKAQITTRRGAVAIIQAPCRLEILGDNSIALTQGKLLGICETTSSKGFVVRTPNMIVTDLGTRFGVDVTRTSACQAHVLQGEIKVARPENQDVAQILKQGWATIAPADVTLLRETTAEPARFASITPRTLSLPGTGAGLDQDAIDPNWQVIAVDGNKLTRSEFLKVGGTPSGGIKGTPPNDPETSQWLRGDHLKVPRRGKQTVFTCRSYFELPDGVAPHTAALVLHFDADEGINRVRLNGESLDPPANSWNDEHVGFNTMRIDAGLVAGVNVIELDVVDMIRGGSTQWSFNVRWHIEAGLGSSP